MVCCPVGDECMILSDNEVTTRLESPLNLINRLARLNAVKSTGMEIFVPPSQRDEIPAVLSDQSVQDILNAIKDDNLEEVMPDNASKIKLGIVKAKALDVLHDSLLQLGQRLPEITKVKDYSTIAKDMKSILADDESTTKHQSQVVIYKPIINDISKYDTLVVRE